MKQTILSVLKNNLAIVLVAFSLSAYGQTTPPPPTGDTTQGFCSKTTWANAGFTTMAGDNLGDLDIHGKNLTWYDGDPAETPPGKAIPKPDKEILKNGSVYYVTQSIGGVESPPLSVRVTEKSCGCIKEPDFENQDDTQNTEGYSFYGYDKSQKKTCSMQPVNGTPVTLGSVNSRISDAAVVTDGDDTDIDQYGIVLSRTNPTNPNSTKGIILGNPTPTSTFYVKSMTKEFIAGEVFVFNYSLVLLYYYDSNIFERQDFFQVTIYDDNNQIIYSQCILPTKNCGFWNIKDVNPPGELDPSISTIYTDWSCFKIDTRAIQGQAARAEFYIGKHLTYVYIDDLYAGKKGGSGCSNYNFGDVAIKKVNPGNNTCYLPEPSHKRNSCSNKPIASLPFPVEICGTFDIPSNNDPANPPVIDTFSLSVKQNGVVVGTVSNPVISGNTWCFSLNATDIFVPRPYGTFQLSAEVDFAMDCVEPYNILLDDWAYIEFCPTAGCPPPLGACSDNGFAVFDLGQRKNSIIGNWDPAKVKLTYYKSEEDAFDQVNKIKKPANFTNSVPDNQTIYVRTDWDLPGPEPDACFSVVALELQVLQEPAIELGKNMVFCGEENIDVTLDATPSNLSELQFISIEWYRDEVLLPSVGNFLSVTEPGIYEVTVYNNRQCPKTDTVVVERVNYAVDLGPDFETCQEIPKPISLKANIVDKGSTFPIDPAQVDYLWNTGATTQSIDITESGTYSVVTTYKGCTQTDNIRVEIAVLPKISLGADFEICVNDESHITASVSNFDTNTLEYAWYRDGGLIRGATGSILPITKPGTYRVEANEPGAGFCIGSDKVSVELYDNENCVITQGISPNGDSYNQSLDLAFLNDRTGIASVEIFNRYGRLVYEKTGRYTDEWFGQTTNGDELVTGTYFYVIKLEAMDEVFKKQVLTGWVYVQREE